MNIFDSVKKMILLKKNLDAYFTLGIVTPWGGDSRLSCIAILDSVAPF